VNNASFFFLTLALSSPINGVSSQTSETKKQKTAVFDLAWRLSVYDQRRRQHVVLRHVLVNELLKSGLILIEANEKIRRLEDHDELFLIEDSFFVRYALERHTTAEDKHREQLQHSWLRADERGTFGVILEEERELRQYEKIQKEDEQ
jgi:hypothetical protein